MEAINEIFFGEHGLTSTSANHLANIAKETVAINEEKLKSLNFVTTKVDIIGSSENSGKVVCIGCDESFLCQIKDLLAEIAEMNAFCAWIREAIKAKDKELAVIDKMNLNSWCKQNGRTFAIEPSQPAKVSEEDIIAQMDIKERNEYYRLEAIAATIGKCIHNDGAFSQARKKLQEKSSNPISTEGNGKDMLIYSYAPSIEPSKVETMFFELQKWHRTNEAQLNKIKFDIKKRAEEQNLLKIQQYKAEVEQAHRANAMLAAEFNEWQINERGRIAKLKIVIPNRLQEVYDKLSALEK